jgi:hypothetical protein
MEESIQLQKKYTLPGISYIFTVQRRKKSSHTIVQNLKGSFVIELAIWLFTLSLLLVFFININLLTEKRIQNENRKFIYEWKAIENRYN